MNGTKIIIKKELRRVFKDKKLVFSLFILPAILMVAIYGLMGFAMNAMSNDITEHTNTVYIANADDTFKSIVDNSEFKKTAEVIYLDEQEYKSDEEGIRNDILNGAAQMTVYFESGFMEKYAAYSKAGDAIPELKIGFNSTENYSSNTYNTFNSEVISAYRNVLMEKRIGNLEMLSVFNVEDELIVKEEKANTEFLSMMLPYMIVIMLFAGAMSVGVDAIAGEKERGTLQSMLLSPVKRSEIVAGKLISLSILSGLSSIVYVIAMIISIPLMDESTSGIATMFGGVSFGAVQILELAATMIVMVLLFVSIISLLAVIAKDVKTASSYISPVYIVVMVAGMLTMFMGGGEVADSKFAIPVYGNALAIKDIIANELTALHFAYSVGSTLILAIILMAAITKAFNSEKVMFNA